MQRCKEKSWIHNQNQTEHFISKRIEDFQELQVELLEFVGQGDRTASEVWVCGLKCER